MPDQENNEKLRELGRRCDDMARTAIAENREWAPIWQDGLDYIFNNQIGGKKREGWEPIQSNKMFPVVAQELSLTVQRRPKIITRPRNLAQQEDVEAAERWGAILQWLFAKGLDMPWFLARAKLDGQITGNYIAKVYWEERATWNAEKRQWDGKIKISLIPVSRFLCDPDASDYDDETEFAGVQYEMALGAAIARWPRFEKELKHAAEKEYDPAQNAADWMADQPGSLLSPTDPKDTGVDSSIDGRLAALLATKGKRQRKMTNKDGQLRRNYVTVQELFFKDRTERTEKEKRAISWEILETKGAKMVENVQVGADGKILTEDNWPREETGRKFQIPVFPNGRHVIRVADIILNPKEEQQVWEHKHWSYVVGRNLPLPHTWRGMNNVEMARGLQDWINIVLAHMCNWAKFFGDPIIMLEDGALKVDEGEDPENMMAARAGSIWILNRGAIAAKRVLRVPPVPMGEGFPKLYTLLEQDTRDQAGMQAIGLGRKEGAGETATEAVRRESNTRLRQVLQATMLDQFTIQVIERVAELANAYWEPGRIQQVTGKKGEETSVVVDAGMLQLEYDIELEVGTALPFDRERKKQDFVLLMKVLGPYGLELLPEALKLFEIDNGDEIYHRIRRRQMMEASLQAQPAAGAGGAEASPAAGTLAGERAVGPSGSPQALTSMGAAI